MKYLIGTAKELGLNPAHLGHMHRRGLAEIVHAPPGGMAKTWRIAEPELTFGALLRRKRIEAGLTIEDLADVTGYSYYAIGDAERDKARDPHQRIVHAVFIALGIRYAEFFAELDGRPVPERLPKTGDMGFPAALRELRPWTGVLTYRSSAEYVSLRIVREEVEALGNDWIDFCQRLDALIGGWK